MSEIKKAAVKPAAPKAVEKMKIGRPSKFSEEIAETICMRIAVDGKSLRNICMDQGMPGLQAVIGWLADDRYVDFRRKYAFARECQADFHADAIIEIADETSVVTEHDGVLVLDAAAIARNRLRVDARKWYAAKLAPKRYGDRTESVHSGSIGIAQILESIDGTSTGLPS